MTDKQTDPDAHAAHPVDRHVGERMRIRRKLIKMSQITLAMKLGLTFQQVQKYERGMNRISASKLYETARALGVPVSFFFEGLPTTGAGGQQQDQVVATLLDTDEGVTLAQAFPRIRDEKIRASFVAMALALAANDDAL